MNEKILMPPQLPERAESLRSTMLELSGADAMENSRFRPVVIARALVSYALLLDGYSETAVGTVLGKDHSTINHYRDVMNKILHSPGYEAERHLWYQFRQML